MAFTALQSSHGPALHIISYHCIALHYIATALMTTPSLSYSDKHRENSISLMMTIAFVQISILQRIPHSQTLLLRLALGLSSSALRLALDLGSRALCFALQLLSLALCLASNVLGFALGLGSAHTGGLFGFLGHFLALLDAGDGGAGDALVDGLGSLFGVEEVSDGWIGTLGKAGWQHTSLAESMADLRRVGAVEKRRALRAAVVATERNMMAVLVGMVWFGLDCRVDEFDGEV